MNEIVKEIREVRRTIMHKHVIVFNCARETHDEELFNIADDLAEIIERLRGYANKAEAMEKAASRRDERVAKIGGNKF